MLECVKMLPLQSRRICRELGGVYCQGLV